MISSRSIHVVANGKISFFFMAELYSSVCVYHTLFIYSSINRHLGYFHVMAIVNNAAVSMGVQISFQVSVFVFLQINMQKRNC